MVKVIDQKQGRDWSVYNADCVEVAGALPDSSVHYSVFSPPFASLYTYSASDRDMGNVRDAEEFAEQFSHLIPQLFRVTKPGRLLSFHCMTLPTSKQRDGFIGLDDFRGELIRAFQQCREPACKASDRLRRGGRCGHGWIFHSEVCIWKDPVSAMQRTKALGLLHKQIEKDSCMSRQGIPDYLVTMRKPGANPEPVAGPFDDWVGEETHAQFVERCRKLFGQRKAGSTGSSMTFEQFLSVNIWQRYASPVWTDIDQSDTLQYQSAREEQDEKHICPLQLQVIRRALDLWTNPGDVVLDPFAGIGSTGYEALRAGRKFVGTELKPSYYAQACGNLANAVKQLELFA